jgi:hypothetical protein
VGAGDPTALELALGLADYAPTATAATAKSIAAMINTFATLPNFFLLSPPKRWDVALA